VFCLKLVECILNHRILLVNISCNHAHIKFTICSLGFQKSLFISFLLLFNRRLGLVSISMYLLKHLLCFEVLFDVSPSFFLRNAVHSCELSISHLFSVGSIYR
jgi:hypothetical protein